MPYLYGFALPKAALTSILAGIGHRGDGDAVHGLVARVRRRRLRCETFVLVGGSALPASTAAILKRTINATRLIYFLYQVLQIVLSPVVALYLLYRGIRDRAYFARLPERLAFLPPAYPATGSRVIWFHAVSVGEVLSAVELIRRLQQEDPGHVRFPLHHHAGRPRHGRTAAVRPRRRHVFYLRLWIIDPWSAGCCAACAPAAVVILETEIWPNLYREAKRAGASLLMVNGRISDRSLAALPPRERLLPPRSDLARRDLRADRRRRPALAHGRRSGGTCFGAGNLKYDFNPPASGIPADIRGFFDEEKPRESIWIAASTMPPKDPGDPDEDDAVIAAFASLDRPGLLLILAPRHPQRFDAVGGKAHARRNPVRAAHRARIALRTTLASCCWIPSASWPRCLSAPTWSSWEARWLRAAATTFSSPRISRSR